MIYFSKQNNSPANCSKWLETQKNQQKYPPIMTPPLPLDIPNILLAFICHKSCAIVSLLKMSRIKGTLFEKIMRKLFFFPTKMT